MEHVSDSVGDVIAHVDNTTGDEWGWGGPLVALRGFGFIPAGVSKELDTMTKVRKYPSYS